MQTILIYDSELGGHHLEYIHHLWLGVNKLDRVNRYVVAIPESGWNEKKHLFDWPDTANLSLRLLSDAELNLNFKFPFQKRCRRECEIVSKVIDELGSVNKLILLNLSALMPIMPFILPKGVKVSGIIYTLPLYTNFSGLRKIKEDINLSFYAHNSHFENVYLLNSSKAVGFYNQYYHTSHFKNLVDPAPVFEIKSAKNLRELLGIDSDVIVFLHFGAMQRRKGTLKILETIPHLDRSKKRLFIFAGKVYPEIKDEFYNGVKIARDSGVPIIIKDEFVDFDDLRNLCFTSDCILAPYLDTSCSSGVIGYGAVFGKPIIGSKSGLLGELIETYHLGITVIPDCTILTKEIGQFDPHPTSSDYAIVNTVEKFYSTIILHR